MKRFGWESFPRKLVDQNAPWKPFPGVYPTRWAIEMTYQRARGEEARSWKYLGKPNHTVAGFVARTLLHAQRIKLKAWEFVRNGCIAEGGANERLGGLPIRSADMTKFRFVDPWEGTPLGRMITTWASGNMKPLPIVYNGRKWVIYSPLNEMSFEELRTHKQWLDAANIPGLRK